MEQLFTPPAPAEIGALYERYAKHVYGVALAILHSHEEAEDVAQEVFLTLCSPTAYDPDRGSLCAFLTSMARSRAIDRLRSRCRAARLLKTWQEEAPQAPAPPTPCDQISTRRIEARVRAALEELPCAGRRVLGLAYYRELSQPEIAAKLHAPLGTVKTRARRALLELERALEDVLA
ncbi:MAG: sigma-70 family RNA polymerase sigma factor [Myxococcota bacterium]